MISRHAGEAALGRLACVTALLAACAHPRAALGPSDEFRREFGRERGPEWDEAGAARLPAGVQIGYATWYGGRLAGRKTASGERYDPRQMTAAHRTLPFGTWVEVRRVDTGDSVRVRVTDRGPFGHEGRIIDLSQEAARRLGMMRSGVVRVELWVVAAP